MDADTFAWVLARVCGLASFAALSISLLTGAALRTAVLDWLASNRSVRSLHEFTAVLWMPLGGLHMAAILLDRTARVGVADLFIPFRVEYGDPRATLAIGLGTLTFELFLLVAVTGWLKRRMRAAAWRWIHRLSYLAFAMLFLHAVLAGTDFSDPVVSALTWATTFGLATIAVARLLWGRLTA
jgi:sulfoxide reductase heme-binding subunit YedZ